LAGYQYSVKIG